MSLVPAPPVDAADQFLQYNVLSPAIRRDLADLNREFLELGITRELADDPRFGWSDAVRRTLLETDEATRNRMAASPFTLFELTLPPVGYGPATQPGRVEDIGNEPFGKEIASRCSSFLHVALFFVWRLAELTPLATRVALGLPPAAQLRISEMCPSQLARLSAWPGLVRPRWPGHRRFWSLLAGASRSQSATALQWAHCIGICLLDTAPHAGAVQPAGDGRQGRKPRP